MILPADAQACSHTYRIFNLLKSSVLGREASWQSTARSAHVRYARPSCRSGTLLKWCRISPVRAILQKSSTVHDQGGEQAELLT